MKLKVFVGNESTVSLDKSQVNKKYLLLECATIYWNFKNIIRDVNNTVENALFSGQNIVKLSDGFWTFEDIQREFKSKGITLIGNYHNEKCSRKSEKDIKMGKFGVMSGFDETEAFTKDVWYHSGEVNINHGLKYIKISADIAERDDSFDENGQRSSVIKVLPVESQQSLFSTRAIYPEINRRVPISPKFSSIRFKISTNVDWPVKMDALLELDIE